MSTTPRETTEAVRQAGVTMGRFLAQAVEGIDAEFYTGYAAKHPELVAACIRAQTTDLGMTELLSLISEIRDKIV